MKKYLNLFSHDIKFIPAFLLLLIIFYFTGCPIKLFTGISCAGCGMTRAWIQLIQLNFHEAFCLHPLVLCPIIFVLVYIFNKFGLPPKVTKLIYSLLIFLFIGVYIYRMLDTSNNIVVFEPKNGLIWKAFSYLVTLTK